MAKEELEAVDTEIAEGSQKKLIIIGAAVAAVIILGLAILLLMGKDGKSGSAKVEVKTGATSKGDGHVESNKQNTDKITSVIYSLQPFVVKIYDGQELRNLCVNIELEMASPTIKPELDANLEPIRNAVVVLLCIKTIQEMSEVNGKNQLKEEILTTINKIISPGKINKIYFIEFIIQ